MKRNHIPLIAFVAGAASGVWFGALCAFGQNDDWVGLVLLAAGVLWGASFAFYRWIEEQDRNPAQSPQLKRPRPRKHVERTDR